MSSSLIGTLAETLSASTGRIALPMVAVAEVFSSSSHPCHRADFQARPPDSRNHRLPERPSQQL